MQYRKEIDGLRALAVVSVIWFHAGFGGLSGGYVGVDVFFVISGFLITGLIIDEMATGHFSWKQFYIRRIRRLLPAAYFVAICCIPPALFLLSPTDLIDFGQSLVAMVTYTSNHLFLLESDYFAAEAELKPLLHTWSLSIEEQYYLIFPVLMWLAFRFGQQCAMWMCVVILFSSIAYSGWATAQTPEAAYFLLPSRAFELMIGSLCAFARGSKLALPRFSDAAGLACVAVAMVTFTEKTAFPGLHALLPTVGTALIILGAQSGSLTTSVLQSKVLVTIGLMSYSLYLWHQPIIAYLKHSSTEEIATTSRVIALLLCSGLAYFSWRFIERPARNKNTITNRSIVLFAGICSVLIVAAGFVLQLSSGHSYRQAENGQSYAELSERFRANRGLDDRCGGRIEADYCQFGNAPDTLIWGDSHAMHLVPALKQGAEEHGFYQRTKSNCTPVIDITRYIERHGIKTAKSCLAYNTDVINWLDKHAEVKTVILAANWKLLDSALVNSEMETMEPGDASVALAKLAETIHILHEKGKRTVVVAPIPRARINVGQCVHKSLMRGLSTQACDQPLNPQPTSTQRILNALDAFDSAPVFRLTDMLCEDNLCPSMLDGRTLYNTSSHLSIEGALWLGENFGVYEKLKQAAIGKQPN